MTSCPEALRILGIWKKAVSWDSDQGEARRLCVLQVPCLGWVSWSWDLSLEEGSRYLVLPRWDQWGLRNVPCVCWWNCLSLLMSNYLKLKKVIKSLVPEPISCFSDSYTRMNIMYISRILVICFWMWICYKWIILFIVCQ